MAFARSRSASFTAALTTAGVRTGRGQVDVPLTFDSTTAGSATAAVKYGATTSSYTLAATTAGSRTVFGASTLTVSETAQTTGKVGVRGKGGRGESGQRSGAKDRLQGHGCSVP